MSLKFKCLILVSLFTLNLYPQQKNSDQLETRVEQLLSKMTLEEKVGQMWQLSFDPKKKATILKQIENGQLGSLLNIVDPTVVNELQRTAIENSRLGIPLIIGRDVIHGFKTIFPIPLGQAASFDPELVEQGSRIAAIEASERGVKWTFAPMLDVSRDARWGRIAESLGEDTYLTGKLGAAMVRGFQGSDLSDRTSIAACAKHFIAYGASEGGRDYNSTNIPERQLRNVYLPPFEEVLNAGAATVMTSFNDNDGVPASANKYLLRNVLRGEWGFSGFVVSDWRSVREMVIHGFAADDKDAAHKAISAGLDMEMVTPTFVNNAQALLDEGKITMTMIDDAVRGILRVKFRLGLFDTPYIDTKQKSKLYAPDHLQAAREAVTKSVVLLKNDADVLPLSTKSKVAIIGPMADAAHDQMGTWVHDGDKTYSITPLRALQTEYKNVKYNHIAGLEYPRDRDTTHFAQVRKVVAESDVAVVFVGEEAVFSGEAHCLSSLNLVGYQSDLLKAAKSAGKPVVMVVMAGRPLTIARDLPYADAVLYSFSPGTMAGLGIMDLLFGKVNPSAKLPVTFPLEVGQIPIYYNHNNTGRPSVKRVKHLSELDREARQSSAGLTTFYLDSGTDPLYPFGYGLSYSRFGYSDVSLSANTMASDGWLEASVTITNTAKCDGVEVAQLYVRDLVGSITRPVKELKGFERVMLKAGESKVIKFRIEAKDLAFYGIDSKKVIESGEFHLWIGGDSRSGKKATFAVR